MLKPTLQTRMNLSTPVRHKGTNVEPNVKCMRNKKLKNTQKNEQKKKRNKKRWSP